jgi:transposase
MSNEKYVGMDVHSASLVIVVMNADGQVIMKTVIETKAETVCDFFRGLRGTVRVAMEEGTPSAWLYHLLQPLVAEVMVCDPRHNKLLAVGNKNDALDAEKLARLLRLGELKAIYKGAAQQQQLKDLVQTYEGLVSDAIRLKNRLKAVYRGRGIGCTGRAIYKAAQRAAWLEKLNEPGARFRAASLYTELEQVQELRRAARLELTRLSREHPAYARLSRIPALGPVRVAQLLARVGSPHRFRTKRQFWPYCGLAVVQRTSAEYKFLNGTLARQKKVGATRGLNRNHCPALKRVFKDAAVQALKREPFAAYYQRLCARGMRPEMARLTLARKLASIVLTVWKSEQEFDPAHLHTTTT